MRTGTKVTVAALGLLALGGVGAAASAAATPAPGSTEVRMVQPAQEQAPRQDRDCPEKRGGGSAPGPGSPGTQTPAPTEESAPDTSDL